jgi:hypothetical protein
VELTLTTVDGVLGGKLWPAAVALVQYLSSSTVYGGSNNKDDSCQQSQSSQSCCLELGSGTGAVGLYAAAAGWFRGGVTVTEHCPPTVSVMSSVPYSVDGILEDTTTSSEMKVLSKRSTRLIDLLQENVNANSHLFGGNPPNVEPLDWTKPSDIERLRSLSPNSQGYDVLLGSDVTYVSQLHGELAQTISRTLKSTGTCWISHQERLRSLHLSRDYQLQSFEEELTKADLQIVETIPFPIQEDNSESLLFRIRPTTKTHKVSILKVQHEQEASRKGCRSGDEKELWLP